SEGGLQKPTKVLGYHFVERRRHTLEAPHPVLSCWRHKGSHSKTVQRSSWLLSTSQKAPEEDLSDH
ncbi:hypothetical protein NDU88_000795, partial [Pleurodeles waltl]